MGIAIQMSSASSSVRNLEWAPKCPCGYGYMILKTSRTAQNPGRRFWKCPDLHGEGGCGLLIWMDEVVNEYSPVRSMGRVQIENREDEMRTLLEEMKQDIKHEIKFLREGVEAQSFQQQHPNYCSYILMMFLLFVAYAWGSNLATRT
ncbi:hypothetical protein CKAN_02046000 [Cinnamomum micranthum f. kanehirae]|uniref:GRF-type domain-containing protein n=1 Tax=Cinnamomum micranthum f. kanehirae TaxID=337451 RepID=A0A3S3QXL5_9MAGN|nr:hypothetical protein CKAN_02046000 [Cinnamomum micranthum f. kanehirae]